MEISDYHRYTSLMRNGFYDKLFFVDKLFGNWKKLLDFGCGDGFLTKMIAEIFPNKTIIGYDVNKDILEGAKENGSYPSNVIFRSNTNPYEDSDVLLLSSVIHEIYAYAGPECDPSSFWRWVFSTGFNKIVIRDMMPDEDSYFYSGLVVNNIAEWCYKNGFHGELERFENEWGPIGVSAKSFTHFLLKYPYMTSPNWDRELMENYIGFTLQDFRALLPTTYRVVYEDNRTLPYFQDKWSKDFGMTRFPKTHTKLILEKI